MSSVDSDSYLALLEELRFEEISQVYHLIGSRTKDVAVRAMTKICSLEGFESFPRLMQLDNTFRATTSPTWGVDWRAVPLSKYAPAFMGAEIRRKLIALATFHPSGYFRSKTID